MGEKLDIGHQIEIANLIRDPKHGSSNRIRDQRRTYLKRRGLIFFDRAAWQWVVTTAGRAALSPEPSREDVG